MNLTLPIFKISELSPIDENYNKLCRLFIKPLKKLKTKLKPVIEVELDTQRALLEKKSGLTRIVGRYRSELCCEGNLKIPISSNIRKEFEEDEEILEPPWRIPSLA